MNRVFLLLGSNMVQPLAQLHQATEQITRQIGSLVRSSSVYTTAPWGNEEQAPFLNQAIEVQTALSPHQVMQIILEIEARMGRIRRQKWEPRVIDIDILFYGQTVMEGNLNIPHPLLQQRRFALIPMVEIAPDFVHPKFQKTMRELLDLCVDSGKVEKLS